jgi:hypothetical protein
MNELAPKTLQISGYIPKIPKPSSGLIRNWVAFGDYNSIQILRQWPGTENPGSPRPNLICRPSQMQEPASHKFETNSKWMER